MFDSEASVVNFLIISISVFVWMTLLFLVLLYLSRLNRAHKKSEIELINPYIEKTLFPMIFDNVTIDTVLQSAEFKALFKYKSFRVSLLISMIKLNKNYAGELSDKLICFYRESGLIKLSLKKIRSSDWRIICEGVRELSLMNCSDKFPLIEKFLKHKNEILCYETLLALIRLKGLEGLVSLKNYQFPMNDWTQLNLLHELNLLKNQTETDVSTFLNSSNPSVCIFGIRFIAYFKQLQFLHHLEQLAIETKDIDIKKVAVESISKLKELKGIPN